MEHFYLITNPSKEGAKEMSRFITRYLMKKGASCEGREQVITEEAGYSFTDIGRIPQKTQCIITLGGDGTLIQAARDLVGFPAPILGINMGTLGYLTQVGKGQKIEPVLDALLNDDFTLERRMMLEGCVRGEQGEIKGIALNDIVLTRKNVVQVLKFKVFVNGEFLNEYTADGVIVSTPTGSTGYNLSAGGPIVTPKSEILVLTPICSHSLNSRSVVLSGRDKVTIQIAKRDYRKQIAVFDGEDSVAVSASEVLEIKRSDSYTTLIKLKGVSFLENLGHKMRRV